MERVWGVSKARSGSTCGSPLTSCVAEGMPLELWMALWPRCMKTGVVVRLTQGAPLGTFQALLCVHSPLPGKALNVRCSAARRSLPADADLWAPQSSREGLGSHLNGLRPVIPPQGKSGREGELWVSVAVQQRRKGFLEFDTFIPKMFCSGGSRSLSGRDWVFLVRETAGIGSVHLSICWSIHPSLCSIHRPAYSLSIHLWAHLDQTGLSLKDCRLGGAVVATPGDIM